MRSIVIRNILRFLALLAVQVLVLDNIYFGGQINPMLYTLFIIMLPNRTGKIYTLLLAFATGLCVDISSNMLGMHTCATTVMAFCRITFVDRVITRGDDVTIDTPSVFTVQPQYFVYYAALLMFIHSLVFYTLDYFSFADFFNILLSAVFTTIATLILAIAWQLIFRPRKTAK